MPKLTFLALLLTLLTGCGTTDSQMLEQGRSASYIQGFHDGRHSGMQEAGNHYEHYIRDHDRFDADAEYRSGWQDGEAEGIKLQKQATQVGNIAAGAYQSHQIEKEVERQTDMDGVAREAVRGVDTSELESLEN